MTPALWSRSGRSAAVTRLAGRHVAAGTEVRDAQRRLYQPIDAFGVHRCVELGEQPLHESQMNRAHDIAVLIRDLEERTVMQQDLLLASGGDGFGGETDLVHRAYQLLSGGDRVKAPERRGTHSEMTAPDLPSVQASCGGFRDLCGHVAGKDVREEPVTALPSSWTVWVGGVEGARSARPRSILRRPYREPCLDQGIQVRTTGVGVQTYLLGHVGNTEWPAGTLQHTKDTGSTPAQPLRRAWVSMRQLVRARGHMVSFPPSDRRNKSPKAWLLLTVACSQDHECDGTFVSGRRRIEVTTESKHGNSPGGGHEFCPLTAV